MTANDKFQTRIMARAMRERGPDRRDDSMVGATFMLQRGPDRRRVLEHYTAMNELAKAQEKVKRYEAALQTIILGDEEAGGLCFRCVIASRIAREALEGKE